MRPRGRGRGEGIYPFNALGAGSESTTRRPTRRPRTEARGYRLQAVAYTAAKGGVVALTRALAVELAPHGIRVNAVAPGFVDTSMTTHSYRDAEGNIDEEKRASYLTSMRAIAPLGITGEADDIANTIWFLAADASRFMTGQILRPNGGMAMPW